MTSSPRIVPRSSACGGQGRWWHVCGEISAGGATATYFDDISRLFDTCSLAWSAFGALTLCPVPRQCTVRTVYGVRCPISLTFQRDVGCWPNSRSSRSSSCENWRGSKDHKSGLCFCLWHGDQMLLNLSPGCFGHSLANKVLVKVTVQQRRFRHGSY